MLRIKRFVTLLQIQKIHLGNENRLKNSLLASFKQFSKFLCLNAFIECEKVMKIIQFYIYFYGSYSNAEITFFLNQVILGT